jgi:hypothetical protein
MIMRLCKYADTSKVVFSFVKVAHNWIRAREMTNLLTRCFSCIDIEFRQFKFPVRMPDIGVEVQREFRSVVFREGFACSVLKKLVSQATPEANDDHLRTIFVIIALKISRMGLKQKIKNLPQLYNAILFVLNSVNYFDWRFHRQFPKYRLTPYWQHRISIVKSSSDNLRLNHVPDAGKVFPDHQLVHNGMKITLGSYYDYGNTHLLIENKGVHEPQEEYAFAEALKAIPPSGSMMELGSYWSFYSMWFAKQIKEAYCLMIEPDPHKMNFGKLNFRLNNLSGTFDAGYITDQTNLRPSIPFYSVDYLLKKHKVGHLNILHSDIQGYELKMLEGCSEALAGEKIDYFFISTHSNELHQSCIDKLKSHNYTIVCEANLDESFSVDGLIVAKRAGVVGPEMIGISKRK